MQFTSHVLQWQCQVSCNNITKSRIVGKFIGLGTQTLSAGDNCVVVIPKPLIQRGLRFLCNPKNCRIPRALCVKTCCETPCLFSVLFRFFFLSFGATYFRYAFLCTTITFGFKFSEFAINSLYPNLANKTSVT